jgi:membrane-bound lytic murein transglycosylase D
MIGKIFRDAGVPQDLIYLAQAESGFQPLALSRAGARGMWQFMASRGRAYGLERDHYIDDRQDPEKSTRAAAQHLKDLYNEFGDWYLAMAAYNSGPVNVQRAVQRTGFADFWELYKRDVLPKETKNYVPIILAMAIIAKNPAQYGLSEMQPDPPLAVDRVQLDYPVDLRLVAQCVDVPLETIQELNPSLLRLTTPKDESFVLNLPAGTRDKYEQAIAAIPPDKRLWWRYHKVGDSETLASIARQYHVTGKSITEVNGLEPGDVTGGTNLLIPIAAGRHAPGEAERVAYSRRPTRYRVQVGDTVTSIADDFGVSAASLRRWNHIKGDTLRRGRTLVIYRPVVTSASYAPSHRKSRKHKKLAASATPAPAKKSPAGSAAVVPANAATLTSTSPR